MRAWVHTTIVLLTSGVACRDAASHSAKAAAAKEESTSVAGNADVLIRRVAPPRGFLREPLENGSFGAYLRELALLPAGSPVLDFRGRTVLEPTDPRLVAVARLDLSPIDVQQCADSIIRLHAEWLWHKNDHTMIYYAASGDAMPYVLWADGKRVREAQGHIVWKAGAARSDTYASFRGYLDRVFTYANTGSISRFGEKVKKADIAAGDYFVLPGSPGHAVLVLDVAKRGASEFAILLGQGFMPAQQFHVIADEHRSAWHRPSPDDVALRIPFGYEFRWDQLRRFAK